MGFNTVFSVAVVLLLNLAGSFCQLDVCGQAPLNNKIVGGQNATAGSWPWQVSMHHISSQRHFCGGSLISKNWILSAAHCVQGNQDIVIYLGRQNQNGLNRNEVSRGVLQVISHPFYDSATYDNDIALIQLSSPVNFTDYIKPVCLAAASSVFGQGIQSWLTGWGVLFQESTTIPDILQEVAVPVVNNHDCSTAYTGLYSITDNMLCAGLMNVGGKDTCQGDSGGPMVSKLYSRWIQSGIVSFGEGCGDPKYPGVYTRVSRYQDWINSLVGSDEPGFVTFENYDYYYYDIFSGSSPSLYLFPLSLAFSIIPLIFSLFL